MSPAVHHASKACLPGARQEVALRAHCVPLTCEVHLFDNLLCLRFELSIARSVSSAWVDGPESEDPDFTPLSAPGIRSLTSRQSEPLACSVCLSSSGERSTCYRRQVLGNAVLPDDD